MFSTSLLSTLLVALAVSANSVVTIRDAPITLQLSRNLNVTNLYQHDLNRAKALNAHGTGNAAANQFLSTIAFNQNVGYVAAVNIGNPSTSYTLGIDTGSDLTWVGANKPYVKTKSGIQTGVNVSLDYKGSQPFFGVLFTDTVTLAPGLAVQKQVIGVTPGITGFKGVNGILGLCPAGLTSTGPIKLTSLTDGLSAARLIPTNSFAISFIPTNSDGAGNQLTWGGVVAEHFTGKINYVPVTRTAPANKYWGIDLKLTYGYRSSQVLLPNAAGILDTGTTMVLITSDAFLTYKTLTGASLDRATKLLTITPAGYTKLQSLYFDIGPTKFEFTANAQIWPRKLNFAIGGTRDKIYLVIGDIGHKAGQGVDVIAGQVWFQRFYSVYDTTNRRIGIANTRFTAADSN